jgi:hypothetical protein
MERVRTLLNIFLLAVVSSAGVHGQPGSGAEQPRAPSPNPGKALVYIYRPHMHGIMLVRRVEFFVNGRFLTELPKDSYVLTEVPPGKVVVNVTWIDYDTALPSPPASVPECAGLNWRQVRLAQSQPGDITRCKNALEEASLAIQRALRSDDPTQEVISLCSLGYQYTQKGKMYSRAATESCLGGIRRLLARLTPHALTQMEIEAEDGKTYYVKWFIPYTPFRQMSFRQAQHKIDFVDEASGAKETRGLRLFERLITDFAPAGESPPGAGISNSAPLPTIGQAARGGEKSHRRRSADEQLASPSQND